MATDRDALPMTPTEVEAKLAEIRAGLEGVTPGGWSISEYRYDTIEVETADGHDEVARSCFINRHGRGILNSAEERANVAHIARLDPPTVLLILSYVESLKAALTPFAKAADCWEEAAPDETLVFGHYPSMFGGQTELRFADFRKARALIAPPAAGATDA